MIDPICHLSGIEVASHVTQRLQVHVLFSGSKNGEPVLFLHGNLCSSTIWEETMLALPDRFCAIALDLRGYGQTDPSTCIDATRGVADWVDDVVALADELGWDRFHLVAHSLGGCVAWALVALVPKRIRTATLVAPGPPCGFGGARGLQGELNHEDGAGSGAGLVHPRLLQGIKVGERNVVEELFSPRAAMSRLYWKPPFRPEREEQLVTAMLQVHLGERQFPGDRRSSPHWPGFAPGVYGPINALSPRYNGWVLPRLQEAQQKPRLLWVYGADDLIVSDGSPSDAGMQGKLGLRTDWPGEDVFPPQPLLSQVTHVLDQYAHCGGTVERLTLPNVGHTPYLERPQQFCSALVDHLTAH